MRFYTESHQYFCGVDLHARSMYVCVLDQDANVCVHRKIPCDRDRFLQLIAPYREGLVVGVECLFCWYWLADLCADEEITFVLGHALYMKAVHGGKSKNDRIDSFKIATLLRGGTFPIAYVYPRGMRSTRDLLRRRLHFVRKRAELLSHIKNTNTQYNLEPFEDRIDRGANREGLIEHFDDDNVQMSIAVDMALLDAYDALIPEMELFLEAEAKIHDASAYYLLRTIPGVGKILALTLLYELHTIDRFPRVQDFLSYSRLVKGERESDGKKKAGGGAKIGNAHLKWAFSEAASLFLCKNPRGQSLRGRLERKHGKGKAMSILGAKLGRAVYYILKRRQPFDLNRFLRA